MSIPNPLDEAIATLIAHLPDDQIVDALSRLVRTYAANAWAIGHSTPQQRGPDGCRCEAWNSDECACGQYGTGVILTPNPYAGP